MFINFLVFTESGFKRLAHQDRHAEPFDFATRGEPDMTALEIIAACVGVTVIATITLEKGSSLEL